MIKLLKALAAGAAAAVLIIGVIAGSARYLRAQKVDLAPAAELAPRAAIAAPVPNLSAQACTVRSHGESLTVTCDSSTVCPPGWHLFTRLLDPAAAGSIEVIFGYGSPQEVENTCMKNSSHTSGLSSDGKKLDVYHVGGAH